MARDNNHDIADIRGGEYSEWISGTGKYTVEDGYEAYAFQPGSSGVTIDDADWQKSKNTAAVAVTDTIRSQWLDRAVTTGPIIFAYPIATITLSANDGLLYCRKSNWR